jgi:Dolichyl-phosphate-mannose-protein mannosyltransferase
MPDQVTNPMSERSSALLDLIVERASPFALAILIVYAAIRNLCQSATKPFWYDEICSSIIVKQPRISTMWSALKQGADSQPPGFYLAERLATKLMSNEAIAFRLLSVLAFSVTVICLFLFIRRREGSLIALLCAAVPFVTVLYDNFAVEGRPYSLVFACISVALLCYQRAPAASWVIVMGLSLVLAQSFHYYAFMAFLPFFVSETALLLQGQFRWGVWVALVFGFLPLLVFWPLLSVFRALYSQHYWSPASLQVAQSSYSFYFKTSYINGITLACLSAIAVLAVMLQTIRRARHEEPPANPSLHEPLMILTFISLPFVGFIATKAAGGGLTPKYVLPAILGFPLSLGYVLPRLARKRALLESVVAIFLIVVLVHQERMFWRTYTGHLSSPADKLEVLVRSAGHEDLPVVICDPQIFMPLAHYASPEWAKRFVMLVDPPQSVLYTGSDTNDKELPILASYSTLPVYDFHIFIKDHPVFLLYSEYGRPGTNWWSTKLARDGYSLRPVATTPLTVHDVSYRVFLVSHSADCKRSVR